MQLHDRCQGRSCCCCFHQFPKQQPTLHVPCQPPSSLTNRCSTPLRSNTPHVESSRRVWSRCFSRSSLEPQQGCLSRTQPPSPLPEARVEGTESNRQHGEEPQAQEQLLTAIRHAASLQQLRALFVQLQQCHERRDGSLGTSDMRLTLFTLFLRAGKLLLHRQKDLDRSLLQRIRSMARPNQQRPGLNMPTPSLVHPAPPTTYSHPMQQPPLQQSTLQQKMQGAQDAARSCQAGQGSINDGSNSSSSSSSRGGGGLHAPDDSSIAHTLLQSMLHTSQPWLTEAQPHETAYILLALGAARRIPQEGVSDSAGSCDTGSSCGPAADADALQEKGPRDMNAEDCSSSSNTSCSSGRAASPYEPEVRQLLQAAQPLILQMKPSHLARVIWGAGAVGFRPSPDWIHAAEQRCAACSTSFGTSSCLLLIEGLALLQHQPHPGLLSDLAHSLKPRLSWLTPAELATLLHSLAVLGFVPPPAWLHQFFQHTSSKVPGFTPTQFAQVSSALARLRYVPPLWWVRRFMSYSHRCMGFFPATELAITAYSLVRLNLVPPRAWLHDALGVLRALPPPPGAGMPKKARPADTADQLQLLQLQRQKQQQQQPQQHAETPLPWPHSKLQPPSSPSSNPPSQPPSSPSPSPLSHPNPSLQPPVVHPPHTAPQLRPPPHLPFPSTNAALPHSPPSTQDSQARPRRSLSSSNEGSCSSSSRSNGDGSSATSAGHSRPKQLLRPTMPLSSRQVSSRAHHPRNHVTTLGDTARRRGLRLASRGREGVGGVWLAWRSREKRKLQIGSRVRWSWRGRKVQQSRGAIGSTQRSMTGRCTARNRNSSQGSNAVGGSHEAEGCTGTGEAVANRHRSVDAQSRSMPVAAAAPATSPQSQQRVPALGTPAAHDGIHPTVGREGSRWRTPVPLSLQDTFRVVYVVAKLRKDPAVERHVSWARAQLPRLLGSVGTTSAHAFYPTALATPLSRSTARPTHVPQPGPQASSQPAVPDRPALSAMVSDGQPAGLKTRFPKSPSQRRHPLTQARDEQRLPGKPPRRAQRSASPAPPSRLASPAALPPEVQRSPEVEARQHHRFPQHTPALDPTLPQHFPQHTPALDPPSPSPLHPPPCNSRLPDQAHSTPHPQKPTQMTHPAPAAHPDATPEALPTPAAHPTSASPRHQHQQSLHPQVAHAVQQQPSHLQLQSQQQQRQQHLQLAPHLQQQLLVDHMYLCAELKHQPEAPEMARLLQLMHPLLPAFSPSNCVTVLVCLAVLNVSVSAAWASAFSRRLQSCMPSLHATDLGKACIAAAHLRLDMGDEFLGAVLEHATRLDLVQLAAFVRSLDGSHAASNVAWLSSLRQQAKRLFASRA